MARIFYAKARIFSNSKDIGHSQTTLQTFGFDETEARENVTRMIFNWGTVDDVKIIKVSTRPINLEKYVIVFTAKYQNGNAKKMKFNTKADDPSDAENFFQEAVATWNHVVNIEIHSIEKRF